MSKSDLMSLIVCRIWIQILIKSDFTIELYIEQIIMGTVTLFQFTLFQLLIWTQITHELDYFYEKSVNIRDINKV